MTAESAPRTALVFPGQGSQLPGMGQELAQVFPAAREVYERASGILGYDLLAASRDDHGELSDTTVVQPAILVHSVASWHVLRDESQGFGEVVALAGHSLGEISALVCAQALDLERAVTLVQRRARLMAESPSGGMRVVFGLGPDEVGRACARVSRPGHVVATANVNSDEQTVISGHRPALEAVSARLQDMGGVVRGLPVSVAPHSPLMEAVAAPYAEAVRAAEPGDCVVPVVSSTDGVSYRGGSEAAERLVRQLTECVSWPAAVRGLLGHGARIVVELGPKTVLRDLTRTMAPGLTVLSCGDPGTVTAASRFLASARRRPANVPVNRGTAENFLTGCLRLAIGTPFPHLATEEEFENGVREPYEELRRTLAMVRARAAGAADGAGTDVLTGAARRVMALLEAKGIEEELRRELVGDLAVAAGVGDEVMACLV
ncbi:ACP S-malonyltransferase [Streptomyces sp. ML-6]|uniref:ACP S-malonyltransferase n=1 Tax=Streptomyces sp. ML-6 TaxID=2982693 RepID=UPI0024C0684E|nr:ACP S-malonyltransferase [Streptomyces sp. ML-6]MDK0517991.1 ACP S-malonyltransferase [Streptomyces sp. ML-6]